MASTQIRFNPRFFDQILKSQQVAALTRVAAEHIRDRAKAAAPVDTSAYHDGIVVRERDTAHRKTFRVVGTDAKTMLIEAKTGNLARALRAEGS